MLVCNCWLHIDGGLHHSELIDYHPEGSHIVVMQALNAYFVIFENLLNIKKSLNKASFEIHTHSR